MQDTQLNVPDNLYNKFLKSPIVPGPISNYINMPIFGHIIIETAGKSLLTSPKINKSYICVVDKGRPFRELLLLLFAVRKSAYTLVQ